jgi:thiamine-monophosphate kinase
MGVFMIDDVKENELIGALARRFARSPRQVNALHESDAELIRLPGLDALLAVTVDAIVEEIELGLYDDPFLIGWMTVTVAVSDLAAVGADPLGVLLVEALPPDLEDTARDQLQEGIDAACTAYNAPVLGGDTNSAPVLHVAGVAVGLVPAASPLMRIGAQPGHVLCTTGPLGSGSAFAALRRLNQTPPFSFQPRARLDAGRRLRERTACCMDTSDGTLAALDQLMRLNDVGFHLDDPDGWLHPAAHEVAQQVGVPPWMMLAGLHGEFELLFCLPSDVLPTLQQEAAQDGWQPVQIGSVIETPRVELQTGTDVLAIDTGSIRDLFTSTLPPLDELIQQIHACAHPLP